NVIPVERILADEGAVQCPFGKVALADGKAAAGGADLLLMIRPEHIEIALARGAEAANAWPAKVKSVTFLGNFTECVLDLAGHELLAQTQGLAVFRAGQDVFVHLPPEKCAIVRDDGGVSASATA
ncbi:MAG: hypothetical protein RL477_974, partial [Pseudomonadota bacterium]